MKKWVRTTPLHSPADSLQNEEWVLEDTEGGFCRKYPLWIYLGKPIDILSLKLDVLEDLRGNIDRVKETRTALFSHPGLETVPDCPVCGANTDLCRFVLQVYSARYHECSDCGHFFVSKRPGKHALDEFYQRDGAIAATYTDKRTSETRVRQVARPKAEWMVKVFQRLFGRRPAKIVDVGAGGGHFVKACRDMGLDAEGIELSDASREYCRDCFGFDLKPVDFIQGREGELSAEIVTFWGVIEHVPYPVEFLRRARACLQNEESLVIAEVPRWDCLGTGVQLECSESLVRHLNPMGHINIFSDSSLATAFDTAGLAPAAAWYFGMDAYEMMTQIAYHMENEEVLEKMRGLIGVLQNFCDAHRFSDEVVLAGTPRLGKW